MIVGKNNKGMPKSRENTKESSFGISPVKSQGQLTQINTVRIHDKIMVTDGVNPLRFYYIDDPYKLLYVFDEEGNVLYTGHNFSEVAA